MCLNWNDENSCAVDVYMFNAVSQRFHVGILHLLGGKSRELKGDVHADP